MHGPFHGVQLDDNPILAQLFLNKNHLLRPFDHKVASRIQRAFSHPRQLCRRFVGQNALAATQHDWEAPDIDIALDNVPAASVVYGDDDWSAVRDIAKAAFVRSDPLVNCLRLVAVRESNVYIRVLEPETRVDIRSNLVVRFDDIFYIGFDEIIERIDVLLDETFDFQESGQ